MSDLTIVPGRPPPSKVDTYDERQPNPTVLFVLLDPTVLLVLLDRTWLGYTGPTLNNVFFLKTRKPLGLMGPRLGSIPTLQGRG